MKHHNLYDVPTPPDPLPGDRSDRIVAVIGWLLLAFATLLAVVGVCLAAPVPKVRTPKPLTEKGLRVWLAAGPVVMTRRGTEYYATFAAPSDYRCGNLIGVGQPWHGDWNVYSEGGIPHIWVREYFGEGRTGTPLEFKFPVVRQPDGKFGGMMDGGGECYLSRAKKSPEGR